MTASAPDCLRPSACSWRRTRPVTLYFSATSRSRTVQPIRPGPMMKTFLPVDIVGELMEGLVLMEVWRSALLQRRRLLYEGSSRENQ